MGRRTEALFKPAKSALSQWPFLRPGATTTVPLKKIQYEGHDHTRTAMQLSQLEASSQTYVNC
jgi:hypothetical protein